MTGQPMTGQDRPGHNWAGNLHYSATSLQSPRSVEELAEVVGGADRLRAVGSRHSFSDVADTTGVLVSLDALPTEIDIDEHASTVRVSAATRYGALAEHLHAHGWALSAMASLPHISVAGAVATGTHGSGDTVGSLASGVVRIDYVAADGTTARIERGEADFAGYVVALGALGVVTHLHLRIEPTYQMRQDVYLDIAWATVEGDLDAITSATYSVSLFTDYSDRGIAQAWLKSRGAEPPAPVPGGRPATEQVTMLLGADRAATTQQGGLPGPWFDRLPHFRMEFTPSRGEELQSEYLVPRPHALQAIEAMRELSGRFAGLLQVAEIRSVAADDLWLSGAYDAAAGTPGAPGTISLHFTWVRDEPAVRQVGAVMEEALLPLGARPHWAKVFLAGPDDLAPLYPRWTDFVELRRRVDPDGRFANAFIGRVGLLG